MHCPRCHNPLTPSDRFCTRCGLPIPRETAFGKAVKSLAKAVGYIFLFLTVQGVVSGTYTTALAAQAALQNGGVLSEEDIARVLENVYGNVVLISLISSVVTILLLGLFFALRRKSLMQEACIASVPFSLLAVCAAMGTAFNVVVSITLSLIPLPADWVSALEEQYSYIGDSSLPLEILSTVVLTGIVEELIFRGLVDSRLRRFFPKWAVVLLSALLFGFCHGTIIAVLYATVVGILFSLLTWRYNSILPSITAHMFFNLTSFWLVFENPVLLLGLYLISISVLVLSLYALFRKPIPTDRDTFSH